MTAPPAARPVVLLAEDDEDVRALAQLALRRTGAEVVAVADGEAAVRAAAEHRPAVAVLDVSMPGLDGYEVTRAAAGRPRHRGDADPAAVGARRAGRPRARRRGRRRRPPRQAVLADASWPARVGSCSVADAPPVLWRPSAERRGALAADALRPRRRPRRRALRGALALVGRPTSRASGRRSGRTSASAPTATRRRSWPRARCPARGGSRTCASATPSTCFRGRDDDALALQHASELRALERWTWGDLRAQVAAIRGGLRRAAAWGRATASPPTCRTSPRRSRPSWPRRRWARSGRARRRSSARARSSTASRRSSRRSCSPSTATATAGEDFDRRAVGDEIGAEPSAAPVVRLGYLDGTRLGGGLPRRPTRRARASSACPFDHPLWVLYSLGHDRAAEGDRPRPRRHPARAPQEDAPAPRRAGGRPRLLVHDDRLDDVELPRRRAC